MMRFCAVVGISRDFPHTRVGTAAHCVLTYKSSGTVIESVMANSWSRASYAHTVRCPSGSAAVKVCLLFRKDRRVRPKQSSRLPGLHLIAN